MGTVDLRLSKLERLTRLVRFLLASWHATTSHALSNTGIDGIIKKIRDRVGTENPVYLSIDIDTLDPACMFFSDQLPSFSSMSFLTHSNSRTSNWYP